MSNRAVVFLDLVKQIQVAYIGDILYEPDIALKIYSSIKAVILSLCEFSLHHTLLQEEPYFSMGIRRISVENYAVFMLLMKNAVQYIYFEYCIFAESGKV